MCHGSGDQGLSILAVCTPLFLAAAFSPCFHTAPETRRLSGAAAHPLISLAAEFSEGRMQGGKRKGRTNSSGAHPLGFRDI